MNQWLDWITAIASLATAGALFVAIWQLGEGRKQARTDFEDELNREYREIIHNIPIKAFLGGELSDQEYQDALRHLYKYIDLSNQQVFLRQQGRIGKNTWGFWRDGIESNLSRQPFDRAWKEIKEKGQQSFSELRRLEASGFEDDPKRWRKE